MIKNYSTKSWHYRLAAVYGNMNEYNAKNYGITICEYVRHVLIGIIGCLLVVVLGSLGSVLLLAPLAWIIMGLLCGFFVESIPGAVVVGLTMYALALLIGGFIGGRILIDRYIDTIPSFEQSTIFTDNFITHAYKTLHDKTCFKLVLTEEISELNIIPHRIGVKLSKNDNDRLFTFMLPVNTELPRDIKYNCVLIYDFTAEQVIDCVCNQESDEIVDLIEELKGLTDVCFKEAETLGYKFYWSEFE